MAAVAQFGTHMHHAPSITKEPSRVKSTKDAHPPPALIRDTEFARQTYAILHKTMFTILRDRGRSVNGHADGYDVDDPIINSARETLIRMCQEFTRIHGREAERSISHLDLSISMRHQMYHQTAEAMFEDEVNWGRIIAFVSFTITVAEKVYDMHTESRLKTQMVEDIEVWLNAFFFNRLQGWITKFGGWVSPLLRTLKDSCTIVCVFKLVIMHSVSLC